MTINNIAQKIWSYCDTLRDDGLGYNDYLEQLTYLLFLKMADENQNKYNLPEICNWKTLVNCRGGDLLDKYENALKLLASSGGMLEKIFLGATNKINDSAKLSRLLLLIDEDNWTSTETDVKGEIYETLLQKNAENSGAGQYFTPRAVIQTIVDCIKPKPMETIADPSCGTGGFFLGAMDYLTSSYKLTDEQESFLKFKTFNGWEIEKSTARLCLMNLFLHGIGDLKKTPEVHVKDSLKSIPAPVDIVLANPPFGKTSSDIPTNDQKQANKPGYFYRPDFWVATSNKQLSFLQHIINMLKDNGRAAVVLPDNVLFEGGAGEIIRRKLLEEYNLHTILRLPTGIFYAQGVKSNVLFFDKARVDLPLSQRQVWFYDYRTNVRHSLKKNAISKKDLLPFIENYNLDKRSKINADSTMTDSLHRWKSYKLEELLNRDRTNLDIFWIRDDSDTDTNTLPEPEVLLTEIINNVQDTLNNLKLIRESLNE